MSTSPDTTRAFDPGALVGPLRGVEERRLDHVRGEGVDLFLHEGDQR